MSWVFLVKQLWERSRRNEKRDAGKWNPDSLKSILLADAGRKNWQGKKKKPNITKKYETGAPSLFGGFRERGAHV